MSRREDLLPQWATQYYVAGRLAARAGLIPVYGNLLHHAVEMYLKTALVGLVSPEKMRSREYGHNLEWLWQRCKEKEADPALDRFDATIHALHEFEELRYPDKIPHSEIMMAITWRPSDAVMSSGDRKPKQYEVFISDVDGLIIEILDRASLNPEYFMGSILGDSGRAALMYLNPHAARWGLDQKEISGIDS
jgi:hypothetical protein